MPLEDKDLETIKGLIKADGEERATAMAKEIEKTVGKAVKGLKLADTIKAEIAKLAPAADDGDDDDADGDDDDVVPPEPKTKRNTKGGDGGPADTPELRKLRSEVEKVRKHAEAQQKRADDAEAARMAEKLSTNVRDALIAAGVDAKRVRTAFNDLRAEGRIKLNDKGEPVFVYRRDWGDEEVAIDAGAKEFVKTDDGKQFLPPTNGRGTGEGGGGPARGGPKPTSAASVLGSALSGGAGARDSRPTPTG